VRMGEPFRTQFQVSLEPRRRKLCWIVLALVFVGAYGFLVTCEFVASYYAERGDFASLQKSARLQPGNAEYADRLGIYFHFIANNRTRAVQEYKRAVQLNSHSAQYWLHLASGYQLLDDREKEFLALERAIAADPSSPAVAYQAANAYLVERNLANAFREFRVVLQNEPSLSLLALHHCWQATPDVDALLKSVMPPQADAYISLLQLLMQKKETSATEKAWAELVRLKQPFAPRELFEYVKYLVQQHEPDQAALVWQQGTSLIGYSAYLPSPSNLIVNGNFSLDVLNGGFDWSYQKQESVELTLDPSEFHSGHRSLSIVFDGPGLSDAGIYQFVAVQPTTTYTFTAYFKAGEIEGAGGPHLVLQDVYSGKKYFESDELKNAEFWSLLHGVFTTDDKSKLLVLHVERVPNGSAIRGKLWIDDLELKQQ
jgi:tetratricopeptide (TPR) repeat protein